VVIDEKLVIKMTRDGGCENMEVKGSLALTLNDEGMARAKVLLSRGATAAYQFQTHPQVNKAVFTSDAVIALKQPERPFPVGAPLGVLRWRAQGKDDREVPFTINCWPEEAGNGLINVNMEYALQRADLTLHDVLITVPLHSEETPRVVQANGMTKHNTRENVLTWHLNSVSQANASGSLEFNIKGRNVDAFFPITITFSSGDTLCPLEVTDLVTLEDERSLRYSVTKTMSVESYEID
jgi:hypothetical protein